MAGLMPHYGSMPAPTRDLMVWHRFCLGAMTGRQTRLELEQYGTATRNPIDDISPRQHELALRFGVNLVIYALTGSYKGDQVHLPAILERLGR